MSYKDEKFGTIFPTRVGRAIGSSNERTMLSAIGGADSFRTRLQHNPDGTTTILRTKNGMPQFITLSTTISAQMECLLSMDSGIVDLHSAGTSAGTIYATNYVAAQILSTVDGEAIGLGEIGNLDGKGMPVLDGSDSISFVADPNGPMLSIDRRHIALTIPASLFTGRTKGYVKALIGSPRSDLVLSDASLGLARPILAVSTQSRIDALIPASNIGSGCGIFKSPIDHKHFLIFPSGSVAYIYPMETTPCVERFRKFLSSEDISTADKERIEAYILAHSIPAITPSQAIDYPDSPTDALGYGWHFNFDGNVCDLVDVKSYTEDGFNWFESTHIRLSFAYADGSFSVTRSIVSGPDKWSVSRNKNVIAFPDWTSKQLIKAGNLPAASPSSVQTGTVYAFYRKNELMVVSYQGSPSTNARTRTSTPTYYGGTKYESYFIGYLKTGESGVTKAITAWTGYTNVFSCGGVSVGVENFNRKVREDAHTWIGRTHPASTPTIEWAAGAGTWNVANGDPHYSITYGVDGTPTISGITWTINTFTDSVVQQGSSAEDRWHHTIKTYSEVQSSSTLLIIPFYDAQAVYFSSTTTVSQSGSVDVSNTAVVGHGETVATPVYGQSAYVADQYVNGVLFSKNYIIGLASNSIETNPEGSSSHLSTDIVFSTPTLICEYGSIECSPPDQTVFYSAEVLAVPQFYTTLESVNGVVLSPETNIMVGSGTYPIYPSLVGWA